MWLSGPRLGLSNFTSSQSHSVSFVNANLCKDFVCSIAPVNIRFPPPSVTDVSFIVQWDAVINQSVDTYVVSVHWTDDRYKYRTQSVTVHGTSYTVTGLTPNTTYIVSVVAVDESGCNGLASDGEEVTTTVSVSMDTTSTINTSSINPTVTTVTTDNSITINTTINSDTKLVPTLDVTVTSNFIPNMIATNPVDTTGKLVSISVC